ncbi:hypothetical protein, partial [Frankia nepalensis]|uniref:hypothetical protein n=1 Tax=Frankia nepalensis TaxID=1836974 RepID=UPI00288A2047
MAPVAAGEIEEAPADGAPHGASPAGPPAGRRSGGGPVRRSAPVVAALRGLRELRDPREAASERQPEPSDLTGRVLPVPTALAGLLPQRGLPRGATVAVEGSAALLLAVLAEPSRAGAWCAVVGCPALGLLAAAEAGIALERLVLVPNPGQRWPVVVAALVDALELVAVCPPDSSGHTARRLAARARERGCLLLPVGAGWDGADLRLAVEERYFHGLGEGHGHLRGIRLLVRVSGRGAATRPRRGWLTVAGPDPVPSPRTSPIGGADRAGIPDPAGTPGAADPGGAPHVAWGGGARPDDAPGAGEERRPA